VTHVSSRGSEGVCTTVGTPMTSMVVVRGEEVIPLWTFVDDDDDISLAGENLKKKFDNQPNET
jgi:hypothetical protein